MAAVTCVLAPVALPIGPIPITLCTLVIYLTAYLLPWRWATAATVAYILLGAVMWASRSLDRHSPGQLIGGSAVPVLAMGLCILWAA